MRNHSHGAVEVMCSNLPVIVLKILEEEDLVGTEALEDISNEV